MKATLWARSFFTPKSTSIGWLEQIFYSIALSSFKYHQVLSELGPSYLLQCNILNKKFSFHRGRYFWRAFVHLIIQKKILDRVFACSSSLMGLIDSTTFRKLYSYWYFIAPLDFSKIGNQLFFLQKFLKIHDPLLYFLIQPSGITTCKVLSSYLTTYHVSRKSIQNHAPRCVPKSIRYIYEWIIICKM